MSDEKNDMVERFQPKPYLRAVEGGAAKPGTDAAWPTLADPYRAAGTPDNDAIARLVVVMGRDRFKPGGGTAYHALQYAHIGAGEFGFEADGQWFRFPFHEPGGGSSSRRTGAASCRTGDYISLRRMPWIRLADRDFRPGDGVPDDEPIFTRIEVEEVKEGE